MLLIKQGRIVDPQNKIDKIADVFISGGKIREIRDKIKKSNCETIDACGKIVIPGLVDIHCHLREPGQEDKETILSGARAAAKGGFTTLCCMPNTQPVADNQEIIKFIYAKAKETKINIYPLGAVTKKQEGRELAEMGELKKAGVVALSDDGNPIENSKVMRRALEYARMFNLLISVHCEDRGLSKDGLINESFVSTTSGLQGVPTVAESIMVARDIQLAQFLNVPIHFCHISCQKSVQLIRQAKKEGIKITCETAPHYWTLTEECTRGFDPNFKINPPLRSKDDVEAIKQGLKDGTIDAIATDHAPHSSEEKELPFSQAPFGTIGLETALSLGITELVEKDVLDLPQLIEKMSVNPAKIFNLPAANLSIGNSADLTVVDLDKQWIVKKENFLSKSKNSAFLGKRLKGEVVVTICKGKVVYKR
ncbi:MAG: dihydroorotase [Candidatus Omnitrophica bacterium]|nr:dihydroorotase [Candidatus Omnitrophota bacterium]